jgi:hypothetical protein
MVLCSSCFIDAVTLKSEMFAFCRSRQHVALCRGIFLFLKLESNRSRALFYQA